MDKVDLINRLAKQFEASLSPQHLAAWLSQPEDRRKRMIFTAFVESTPQAKDRLR